MSKNFQPSKMVEYWLYLGIVLVLAMVVIGGITRLTHSGLSMVHWTFHGSLPPMEEAAWEIEFNRYKDSPEFKSVHAHFELADFKSIYWWEYIHRMFGRMIGLVFIFPFAFFLIRKKIPKALLPHFFAILTLGAFQAFLGWFMVKSGLVDVPRVSHYRLSAHLITAFIACSYILWVALRYKHHGSEERNVSVFRKRTLWFGVLLLVQIIFGGFVAGLKAGWIHNTWPLMDGSIVSSAVFAMDPVWLNFFEGKSGVQFIHRTLGVGILIGAVVILRQLHVQKEQRLMFTWRLLTGAIVVQFLLGVFTLVLAVPIALGVIHQVMALITLLAWVKVHHSQTYRLA